MSSMSYEELIVFHPDLQIMEVDFSGITFDRSKPVNEFYDVIDRRLAESGQKWFFLVNYLNCKIMTEAWIAFAHRGKMTNIGYSMGSARFASSDATSKTIMEKSKEEDFDPNLFSTRDSAVAHLEKLRSEIPAEDYEKTITKIDEAAGKTIADRVKFHDDLSIMEVDFSEHSFANSRDVKAFYDYLGERLEDTGKQWYFMVNYNDTEILPDAWYQWSLSSKKLNSAHSLGSVRFNKKSAVRKDIQKRADADDTDANLVGTREEALARIEALKNAG